MRWQIVQGLYRHKYNKHDKNDDGRNASWPCTLDKQIFETTIAAQATKAPSSRVGRAVHFMYCM